MSTALETRSGVFFRLFTVAWIRNGTAKQLSFSARVFLSQHLSFSFASEAGVSVFRILSCFLPRPGDSIRNSALTFPYVLFPCIPMDGVDINGLPSRALREKPFRRRLFASVSSWIFPPPIFPRVKYKVSCNFSSDLFCCSTHVRVTETLPPSPTPCYSLPPPFSFLPPLIAFDWFLLNIRAVFVSEGTRKGSRLQSPALSFPFLLVSPLRKGIYLSSGLPP